MIESDKKTQKIRIVKLEIMVNFLMPCFSFSSMSCKQSCKQITSAARLCDD